jgi:hypothetical protein
VSKGVRFFEIDVAKQIHEFIADAFALCDDVFQVVGMQRRYFATLIYNLLEALELVAPFLKLAGRVHKLVLDFFLTV